MRKKIAAANWKMNLTLQEGEQLLDDILGKPHEVKENQLAIFAVPAPYIAMAQSKLRYIENVFVAAQNCFSKKRGAYTGEISVEMLSSLGVQFVILGHSERREYFNESNSFIADKINICLENNIQPIFCCGEPLSIREEGTQNEYVSRQLVESLYQLEDAQIHKIIIAYEPIWAIGTGKTASSDQAQEMHAFIRSEIRKSYGDSTANSISILYGGSVKGANAVELFTQPDVDGGLVGGASLIADEFVAIINALQ